MITYRRATVADAAAVAYVHCASWRTTYDKLLPADVIDRWTDIEQRTRRWAQILARSAVEGSTAVCWLAEEDRQLLGFATGDAMNEHQRSRHEAQLSAIYLLQSAQRRGIGHELVARVFADLSAAGFVTVYVDVLQGNDPAIRFYESLGARYVKTLPLEHLGARQFEHIYRFDALTIPS